MITLNYLLFIIFFFTLFIIVTECYELYLEDKKTKKFIESLEKGEKDNV